MFRIKKPMKYEILIPPLEKPIDRLSSAEAQAYFDWFTGKLEDRTDCLRRFTKLRLDHTPDSLVPLWKWFLRHAALEKTPQPRLEELRRQFADSPLADAVLRDNQWQFSPETECILYDIGMYWGQVFVKNHPSIRWGFYTAPKRDMFVNRPLLLGFPNEVFPEKKGPPFEPVHMAHVQASKLFRNTASDRDLLNIHLIWEDKLRTFQSDA